MRCGWVGQVSIAWHRVTRCWAVLDFRPVLPLHDVRKWPQKWLPDLQFLSGRWLISVAITQ